MNHYVFEMLTRVGKLKTLPRTGWGMVGIDNAKSIADHVYRVAFMAMLLAEEFKCDGSKLIKMALVHDVGESVVGDIVTEVGTKIVASKQDKHEKEKQAIIHIFGNEQAYIDLWLEFEAQETHTDIVF